MISGIEDYNLGGERYVQDHAVTHLKGQRDQLLWQRQIKSFLPSYGGTNTPLADYVYLGPIEVKCRSTIDRIAIVYDTPCAGNIRAGLYYDNGYTPVGGALLVETAALAKTGTFRIHELPIVDTLIEPGMYWMGILSDDPTTAVVMQGPWQLRAGDGARLCYYNRGGFLPLLNPCPAVGYVTDTPWFYLRVKD